MRKLLIIIITTFTLVVNASAGSDGKLLLKKMNLLKLMIALKRLIEPLLHLIKH